MYKKAEPHMFMKLGPEEYKRNAFSRSLKLLYAPLDIFEHIENGALTFSLFNSHDLRIETGFFVINLGLDSRQGLQSVLDGRLTDVARHRDKL